MFEALTDTELDILAGKMLRAAAAAADEASELGRVRGDIRAWLYGPGTYEQARGTARELGELYFELAGARTKAGQVTAS